MSPKPLHFSVKALVADGTPQRLVIRRSASSRNHPGLWDLPGGKCEPGEPMDQALVREVEQETGLQIRVGRVIGTTQVELADRIVVYLIFEADRVGGELRLGSEHDAHEWRSPHKLHDLPFPAHFQEPLRSYAQSAKKSGVRNPFKATDYEQHVEGFRLVRPVYARLAEHLTRTLEGLSQSLGLHCLVQARAKTIASFAEKIMRPGRVYANPLVDLTDLCGARVICHTLGGVNAVSESIKKRFTIVPEESGDKLATLAASEFGYRSQHIVVRVPRETLDLTGPSLTDVPEHLSAEIQVRTILQHAWADILHELSYKSRFKLPAEWQRVFARLAAVLEEADREFESSSVGLSEYASSYDAYYTEEQLKEEMEKLAIVLKADPHHTIAHQLARMAILLGGQWNRAIEALKPFEGSGSAAVLRDLGVSLCKLHGKEDPECEEFRRGQELLQKACELDPTDIDAPASLGGTWRRRAIAIRDTEKKAAYHALAKHWYFEAFKIGPTHPYPVGNYIECAIADHENADQIINCFYPSIHAASIRCQKQTEVGVNLPWAYFDLGKFQLMLREPYKALDSYAKGVADSTAAFFIDSALTSFPTLASAKVKGYEWSEAFLRLAKAIRFERLDTDPPSPTADDQDLKPPVVVVVGYCGTPAAEEHRTLLQEAFRDFRGTIVSGGTLAGISAVVGELQTEYPTAIRTIGYVPRDRPANVEIDTRYSKHRESAGADFSPLEPLQYWADLLASKVPINQIRVLDIGGGQIAASECVMALALRIAVGHIAVPGSEVQQALAQSRWSGHPLLRALPVDVSAVKAFLS
ncbi:MAG: NUDIX domain-containing protein [Isosphaerales bacterium]